MKTKPYPNPIHLSLLSIKAIHEAGYTVDRHVARDGYLFEFFERPVVLRDSKQERRYDENVFILYAPGQRQYFRAEGPLTHTWFQVSGAGVAECLLRYQIPVNQAIEKAELGFLGTLLSEALHHKVGKHRYWEDAVTEVFRTFFRRLARALFQDDHVRESPYRRHLAAAMHTVRAQVFKDIKRRWTVEDMATLANMSVPRFAVAYRSYFDSGPIDDLIDVRLHHADLLLRHLPITVVDAAHHSGFNTGSNFHVLFRERMGRSPRSLSKTIERSFMPWLNDDNLLENSDLARRVNLLYIKPVGHWSFDQESIDLTDDLGKHSPVAVDKKVSRSPGRIGGRALRFDGSGAAVLRETIVDTSLSYTICAWLTHEGSEKMTAVSIGNANHGAFYMQYVEVDGGFKFAVTVSDRDPLAISATAARPTASGEWHHVVGVHDADLQEIRLYVDGNLEAKAPYRTPWRADGDTYFGCCQVRGKQIDQWLGDIDDIRMYDEALTEAEIEILYRDQDSPYDALQGSDE